jgi:putative transposase
VVTVRQDQRVINKTLYWARGINLDGQQELLGMWLAENAGAQCGLTGLTEWHNRGLPDVFIACGDGLTGFPEAIETVYPQATVQLCIVQRVRNRLQSVSSKDRKAVAAALKPIYRAATVTEAERALSAFAERWDAPYPSISARWRRQWVPSITIFDYPEASRRVIYTTNGIESLNRVIRKITRNRRIFPSDTWAFKIVFLAVEHAAKKGTMPIKAWKPALNRFAIEFEGRVPLN